MPALMLSRVVMLEHYTWPWEGATNMDQKKHLCVERIPASRTRAALHLIYPADKHPVPVMSA
jgi:hypothetical protein